MCRKILRGWVPFSEIAQVLSTFTDDPETRQIRGPSKWPGLRPRMYDRRLGESQGVAWQLLSSLGHIKRTRERGHEWKGSFGSRLSEP